jgi:hypothetical protein
MGSGGGGGGFAGQGAPSSPRRQLAEKQGVVLFERLDGDVQLAETVRNVGQKTFYRRDGVWIDSALAEKDEKELAKATVVEQFSDEFFEIVRQQKAEDNQYFTFDEPVTLAVNGKLLRIVPPAE